jgi:hypothetical protein
LQATDLSEASEESVEKQLRNVNTSLKSFIYVHISVADPVLFDPWIRDPGWVKS